MNSMHSLIQDGGSTPLSTDTTLNINIVDVLDPAPSFTLGSYSVEISEGSYSSVSCHINSFQPGLHQRVEILSYT